MQTDLALIMALVLGLSGCATTGPKAQPRESFPLVALADIDPSILQEMRYTGSHNFIGRPVRGYRAPRCLLSRSAAEALKRVQKELRPFRFSLKVYDCYRPQRAVDEFVAWTRDLTDQKMKAEFYPGENKTELIQKDYIAERSGHTRGSAVDLTLVPLPARSQPESSPGMGLKPCTAPQTKRFADNSLDMGTGYDCFDPRSAPEYPDLSPEIRANRALLQTVMAKQGFEPYAAEWWHFRLREEPYPDTYFDEEIR